MTHQFCPTYTPLEGADLEGSNLEKNKTKRAKLRGCIPGFQAQLCWNLAI